jgi:hypothetical protein
MRVEIDSAVVIFFVFCFMSSFAGAGGGRLRPVGTKF